MKLPCRFTLIFFSICLLFPQQILAQAEFQTQVETTYRVDATGQTQVIKDYAVTNLTTNTYITQFTLELNDLKLQNIQAQNEGAPIEPQISKTDQGVSINLSFPNQVVGQGQARRFRIQYESPVLANLNSSVLELNLPGQQQNQNESAVVYVEVPLKFGDPYRAQPEFDEKKVLGDVQRFTFRQPPQSSLLLVFGQKQAYTVQMKYELTNNSKRVQQLSIPIPPDTPWQRVNYSQLEPRPIKIERDADGNWLAWYNLPANQTTIITTNLNTELYLESWNQLLQFPPQPDHLAAAPYWKLEQTQLSQLLTNQSTSPHSLYQTAVNKLNYTTESLDQIRERQGAAGTLNQPDNATCQEFTDLFVALARSQGIPARRSVGYAYSTQEEYRPSSFVGDILHTWPEYYDANTQSWRAVDPTWEKTTGGIDYFNHFDLSHLVFVRHGVSSTDPLPPGSYQQNYAQQKTISVMTSDQISFDQPRFQVALEPIKFWRLNLPIYQIKLENLTGQAWYNLELLLEPLELDHQIKWLSQEPKSYVLPFAQEKHVLSLTRSGFKPELAKLSVQTKLENQVYEEKTYTIFAIPELWLSTKFYWYLGGGITCLTLITGSVLVFRRKRQSAVRRQSQESQQASQELLSN